MLDEIVDYNKVLVTWYPSRDPHFVPSKSDYKIDKQDKNLIMYDGKGPAYVMDPLNILHDKVGKPILTEEEKFEISSSSNYHISKIRRSDSWSGFLTTPALKNNGNNGILYRTNRRLIYIREPNPGGEIQQGGGPFGLPSSIPDASWARKLKKTGRKDCVSISLNKIVGCKKKKHKVAWLFIQGWNARYRGLLTHLDDFSVLEGLPEK